MPTRNERTVSPWEYQTDGARPVVLGELSEAPPTHPTFSLDDLSSRPRASSPPETENGFSLFGRPIQTSHTRSSSRGTTGSRRNRSSGTRAGLRVTASLRVSAGLGQSGSTLSPCADPNCWVCRPSPAPDMVEVTVERRSHCFLLPPDSHASYADYLRLRNSAIAALVRLGANPDEVRIEENHDLLNRTIYTVSALCPNTDDPLIRERFSRLRGVIGDRVTLPTGPSARPDIPEPVSCPSPGLAESGAQGRSGPEQTAVEASENTGRATGRGTGSAHSGPGESLAGVFDRSWFRGG